MQISMVMLIFLHVNHTAASVSMTEPQLCSMSSDTCFDVVGGWTVGTAGECFHEDIGFRLGHHGYKYGVLQVSVITCGMIAQISFSIPNSVQNLFPFF